MPTYQGFTNKGLYKLLNIVFRNGSEPTNFYIALCSSSLAPSADTNTLSQLAQVSAGNGYTTGGYQLVRNSTDFDTLTEDDANDEALIMIKDVAWTASGGALPSGGGARYAVLTDDNATVGSREVWAWWDLETDRQVSDGQTLTLRDLELALVAYLVCA